MSQYESYEYEDPEFGSQEGEVGEAYESFEAFESYEVPELYEGLEMELAHELLEITSEEELEEFLGKLVSKVAKGASSFMKSGVGKAIGGVLRNVAKTALPMVGSAIGSFVAPGVGTAIGGKLGSMASKLLEAEELETMGESEAEFEAARRYVRWAAGTVRNGQRAPSGVPPRTVARSAAVSSARRYAPSLLRPGGGPGRTSPWRDRRRRPGSSGRYGRYPRYGYAPAWEPVGQTCSCGGHAADSGGGGDFGQDDDQESESFEVMEAFEAPKSGSPGGGRWYRRGNRIVIVGA